MILFVICVIDNVNVEALRCIMKENKWLRIILLIILAYEGWGGITGGTLLTFAPDGHIMKMPVEIMHGYFPDFLIPGLILTAMGALTTAAFFAVLFKRHGGRLLTLLSMGGYMVWFAVEIILVGTSWLQIMWGAPVVVGLLLVLPMSLLFQKKVVTTS